MSAEIVNLKDLRVQSASNSLSVVLDDFSVKVVSSKDPIFWIRVKKIAPATIGSGINGSGINGSGINAPRVVVTDFNPGSLPQITLNIALRKAVRELYTPIPSNFTFENIVSAELNDNNTSSLDGAVDAIRVACEGFARVSRKMISSFRIIPKGQRFDVVVALS